MLVGLASLVIADAGEASQLAWLGAGLAALFLAVGLVAGSVTAVHAAIALLGTIFLLRHDTRLLLAPAYGAGLLLIDDLAAQSIELRGVSQIGARGDRRPDRGGARGRRDRRLRRCRRGARGHGRAGTLGNRDGAGRPGRGGGVGGDRPVGPAAIRGVGRRGGARGAIPGGPVRRSDLARRLGRLAARLCCQSSGEARSDRGYRSPMASIWSFRNHWTGWSR